MQRYFRSQRVILQGYLRLIAARADRRLRQGKDGPNHDLAKAAGSAAVLLELDERGIVDDLMSEGP